MTCRYCSSKEHASDDCPHGEDIILPPLVSRRLGTVISDGRLVEIRAEAAKAERSRLVAHLRARADQIRGDGSDRDLNRDWALLRSMADEIEQGYERSEGT